MKSFPFNRIPYFAGYGLCSYGRNTPNGQRSSCLRLLIAAGVRPNGREIVTPTRSSKDRLGWKPSVPMEEAMEEFLAQFDSNRTTDARCREAIIGSGSHDVCHCRLSTAVNSILTVFKSCNARLSTYMLRDRVVGCGKVADQHVQAIHRIPGCEIVALCDRELLMAKQLGERFGISGCFSDLRKCCNQRLRMSFTLHTASEPFSTCRQCLESGSHVYLEKPFTITARRRNR